MKRCSKCGVTKPFGDFHRRRQSNDGASAICKSCKAEYDRARQIREREKLSAQKRSAYMQNPEPAKARAKKWKSLNPERLGEVRADYRERYRAELRLRGDQYRDEHKEQRAAAQKLYEDTPRRKRWRRAYYAKRYAARFDAEASHLDPAELFARYGPDCHICGEMIDGSWHLDHVVPLSRGGRHEEENLRPSHPRCNIGKGAKLMDEITPRMVARWRATRLRGF